MKNRSAGVHWSGLPVFVAAVAILVGGCAGTPTPVEQRFHRRGWPGRQRRQRP